MRIVAGKWRGRRLTPLGKGDAGAALRPTPDRVRESLFSILAHLDVLSDAHVLDLFAGTGALGLEALSRGAAQAVLVENGRMGQRLIRSNIELLQAQSCARLIGRDARRLEPWSEAPFDLVFLDPPYGRGLGAVALSSAQQGGWIRPGAWIIWEEAEAMDAPDGFTQEQVRRFGESTLTLLRYSPTTAS